MGRRPDGWMGIVLGQRQSAPPYGDKLQELMTKGGMNMWLRVRESYIRRVRGTILTIQ